MKIETQDDVIYGNNKNASKSFSIASSPKAFKILSSNLYKNKIRAVVRELSCNCLDAHKLNGNKRPFDITVPSWMELQFVIRDYGPGLCETDMENLYTTYFASTKDSSNDFIGALGLGSKSPFSYTDTFMVKSYHDGKVSTYNASMVSGEPSLTLINIKESDSHTGLEIFIPVRDQDIGRWKEEIGYVLSTFKTGSYNIIGGNSIRIDPMPDSLWETGIHQDEYMHKSNTRRGSLFAVYGNILYPLDHCPDIEEVSSWLRMKNSNTYILFDLGELDITPSREELSFDETTIENIKNKLEKFDLESRKIDIEKAIDIVKTKGRLAARSFMSSFPSSCLLAFTKEPLLQDAVQHYMEASNRADLYSRKEKMYSTIRGYNNDGMPLRLSSGYTYNRRSRLATDRVFNVSNFDSDEFIVVINDSKKTLPKVIKNATNLEEAFGVPLNINQKFLLVEGTDCEAYKALYGMSEEIKYHQVFLSDVYAKANIPVVKRSSARPKTATAILAVRKEDGTFKKTDVFWTSKEIADWKGFVVPIYYDEQCFIKDGNIVSKHTPMDPSAYEDIKEYLMIRPSYWKKINDANHIMMLEYIKEDIIKLLLEIDPDDVPITNLHGYSLPDEVIKAVLNHYGISKTVSSVAYESCRANGYCIGSMKLKPNSPKTIAQAINDFDVVISQKKREFTKKFEDDHRLLSSFLKKTQIWDFYETLPDGSTVAKYQEEIEKLLS